MNQKEAAEIVNKLRNRMPDRLTEEEDAALRVLSVAQFKESDGRTLTLEKFRRLLEGVPVPRPVYYAISHELGAANYRLPVHNAFVRTDAELSETVTGKPAADIWVIPPTLEEEFLQVYPHAEKIGG